MFSWVFLAVLSNSEFTNLVPPEVFQKEFWIKNEGVSVGLKSAIAATSNPDTGINDSIGQVHDQDRQQGDH